MSLINEALKKAQRLRTEEPAEPSGATHGGAGGASRGQGHGANTMVLMGSGALVLVVLSVVLTVYLVNRPAKPTATVAASKSAAADSRASSRSALNQPATPAIVAPKITTAPVTVESAADSSPAAPAATPLLTIPSSSTPPPAAASTGTVAAGSASPTAISQPPSTAAAVSTGAETAAAQPPAPALAPGAPDERVAAFVEAIRVTGIRSSGTESRVLMNERVYRVNDIVERNLGVRLIKAAADSLTFSDSRGVTYSKNF